jgi:hypothetical protein
MARSVAEVLISFAPRGRAEVASEPRTATDSEPELEVACDVPEPAREDPFAVREDALAAAHAAGLAEGSARAEAAYAAALECARAEASARLAEARDAWAREEAGVIAAQFAAGLADIEAGLAVCTARILAGFLADRLIERATAELAEHIRALLSGADGTLVRVEGPEDLLAALREKLGGMAAAVEYRPGASASVSVACDETRVESRLSAWLERLAAAVE